ncbi:hypothetical protein GCM10023074_30890 [Microbispora amethystogenes]|uniref:CRISPR-associated endonuclease Cas3 n=2 Tax=Microbispora amethystogenes TaxID=1427754 RepID=A0ABQ4FLH4_9ACTN|nr:hypothetical protein Mam01_58330 [Microbispora amethystogenes]
MPDERRTEQTEDFGAFVCRAVGKPLTPYPYQARLAREGLPELLRVPTGAGKTLAAVLPWLWRGKAFPDDTPRRLVYVLPLRTLVEQTAREVARWLFNQGERASEDPRQACRDDSVVLQMLMGGTDREDDAWQLAPGKPAILIGTQDMVLSRALMRGYAESRPKWPISYALLHSDTQWVFDETQLLGPALPTSAQLQGLRDRLGTAAPTATMWMSATLAEEGLSTADHDVTALRTVELTAEDREGELAKRLDALRTVERLDLPADSKNYPVALARALLARHRPGTRTIAVLNTVERATAVREALRKEAPETDVVLIHSRFRLLERGKAMDLVTADPPSGGRIVISTQVLEAGVDITSLTLFTEAAPWSSIVQRAGRCNRGGEYEDGAALLWSLPPDGRSPAAPYAQEDVDAAAVALGELEGVAVTSTVLQRRPVKQIHELHAVLRRRDLLQLFDTMPDLTGADIDVSPWIRDGDDTGVFVAWRDWAGSEGRPAEDEPRARRDELCPAPIADVRKLVTLPGGRRLWVRDRVGGQWRWASRADVVPGAVLLADARAGWYDSELGWSPAVTTPVEPVTPVEPGEDREGTPPADGDALGDDPLSESRDTWVGLARHLTDVEEEVAAVAKGLRLPGLAAEVVEAAALAGRYHDLGKCHEVFQATLRRGGQNPPDGLLAKSPGSGGRHSRRHLRHELVSALMLTSPECRLLEDRPERELIVYLVAAHHGRVRISVRSVADEALQRPPLLLGVADGDHTPAFELTTGEHVNAFTLSTSSLRIGAADAPGSAADGSWTERAVALRDRPDLGPFRLAYLEALVRIADMRVSRRYREEG